MSDKTPEEQANAPLQQEPSNDPDWQARYTGQVQATERLTLKNRELEAKLQAVTSQVEQRSIEENLALKEKELQISERDKKLETFVEQDAAQRAELARLKALENKIKIVKEAGRPDLLQVIDHIPSVEDPEVMKSVINDFAGFADTVAAQTEERLLAGVTPGIEERQAPIMPTTSEGWQAEADKHPPGSPERSKVMAQWYEWGQKQT